MTYDESRYQEKVGAELRTLIIDFDGTLAESGEYDPTVTFYAPGPPNVEVCQAVRNAALEGYEILVWTARPWSHKPALIKWLADHQIPYETIVMGKPLGFIVDDRSISIKDFVETHK